MNIPDFKTFEADALARGFDEVAEREWAANTEHRRTPIRSRSTRSSSRARCG